MVSSVGEYNYIESDKLRMQTLIPLIQEEIAQRDALMIQSEPCLIEVTV